MERSSAFQKTLIKRTQELIEYNHQLEQFAFLAAHHLRAPVARILGLGELLTLLKDRAEEREQVYPKLLLTTHELDTVVRDLNAILDLKKHNNSYISEVNLADEISLIRENLEQEIKSTQAKIIYDFTQADTLHTVKPYLESILLNLISNAIKYRHPARIRLFTSRRKD